MPAGHDGQHSNERRPSTLSRRWEGDARPSPATAAVTLTDGETTGTLYGPADRIGQGEDSLRRAIADAVPDWCGLVPEEHVRLADALLAGPLAPLLARERAAVARAQEAEAKVQRGLRLADAWQRVAQPGTAAGRIYAIRASLSDPWPDTMRRTTVADERDMMCGGTQAETDRSEETVTYLPDRFRDQLAEALRAFDVATGAGIPDDELADALMPVIAAEVQTCAAEREAEVLEAAARWLESGPDHGGPGPLPGDEHLHAVWWATDCLRERAAAVRAAAPHPTDRQEQDR